MHSPQEPALPIRPVTVEATARDTEVREAIRLGGTATGYHGVGRGKRTSTMDEHVVSGVRATSAIDHALDSEGILNPPKVLPRTRQTTDSSPRAI